MSSDSEDAIESIRGFVENDLLSGRKVADDEGLLLSGLVDSLGVMRLVSFIESSFDIKVPSSDLRLENFANLAAISAYVVGRQNE